MRELEFLPPDYLRARYQRRIGFIRSWLLLAMGLAMVLWSLQMSAWVRNARAELQALHGTGLAVDGDVEKVRQLKQESQGYERRVAVAQTLRPRLTAADVLAALSASLPDAVVLEEVVVNHTETSGPGGGALRVRGVAPSEGAVMNTLAALEASPAFKQAALLESKPSGAGESGGRCFTIEAAVVAPSEKR